ncbi:MAG: peptidylprolyl isomerase [Myxococcota bacterium]|nr:peptidylprolyl isomerase [Myxococcota bacterium]
MRLYTVSLLIFGLSACGGSSEPSSSSSQPTASPATPAASAGADATPNEEDVLVQVGEVVITTEEFQAAAARKLPASGDALSLEEKQEVLDKLISDRLLYLQGLSLGVDKDPKVQKVVVNTLLRDVVYADVSNEDFPEEVLRSYYDANKEDYVIQAKVQIRRILIAESGDRDAAASEAEANRLHAELVANPTRFREIAAKHSDGDFKRRGGDMGFVPQTGKAGVDQALVDRAFGMEVDELSPVFKTEEGYNILMVAKKRERHDRSFQQVRGAVLRKLKTDRMSELLEAYVGDLRGSTSVEVNAGLLEGLEVETIQRAGNRPGFGPGLSEPGAPGGDPSTLGGPQMPRLSPRVNHDHDHE